MQEAWFHKGRRLLRAAMVLLEQLWENKKLAAPLLVNGRFFPADDPDSEIVERSLLEAETSLLAAYAFENFLKGIWVAQNPEKVKSQVLPKELRENSHDLVRLCADVGIVLTDSEKRTFATLSEFAIWRGRYPIALTANQNADSWEKTTNLTFVSSKYPGKVEWPDDIQNVWGKIADKAGFKKSI